jgi:hypothetical protein
MRWNSAAALLTVLCLGTVHRIGAQEGVRTIIEKAIEAHGGEEKLAKVKAVRAKSKGTIHFGGASSAYTNTESWQLPDRIRVVMEIESRGKKLRVIQVLNGGKGWLCLNGKTQAISRQMRPELEEFLYAARVQTLTPLLKDKSYKLGPLGEGKVRGRPTVAVKVSHEGHRDVHLFFDKEKGLLLKAVFQVQPVEGGGQKAMVEYYYSKHKDVDGLKWPTHKAVFVDGKKLTEGEVTEFKFVDKFDDSEFAKP